MNLKDLIEKCDEVYYAGDYRALVKVCDEILAIDSKNPGAIGYKGVAYIFLNQPEKAIEILEKGMELYPKNYYIKNNLSMAYYDIREYEKALEISEEGLKIKNFDWLYENKIKALLKLDRIEEAEECWQNSILHEDFTDLLIEAEKYEEALKYCFEEDYDECNEIIDKVKEINPLKAGGFYISWIDSIRSFTSIETCPDCGGRLLPIVYGYPPTELLEQADREEIFLGGCVIPPNPANYHCIDCSHEFDLGCNGVEIEFGDFNDYAEYKIKELTGCLRNDTMLFIRSADKLKDDLKGIDDIEFNLFITRLTDLGYLTSPREGYVALSGFEDLSVAKEYCDEDKFAAPRWLVYPQLSMGTIGWRMGYGENYVMNVPYHTEEFKRLFPMPRNWEFFRKRSVEGPYPPLGFFWSDDGKPKYPKIDRGTEVNDFITLEDEKKFTSDTFSFSSIEHALNLSKALYFERYHDKKVDMKALEDLEYSSEEEKIWDGFRYAVLLNASYYKVMQDEELIQKLLSTGDEPLVYVSDDSENLFGRALMELRDEIRRLTQNIDRIDWEFTEYLKHVPWM